MSVNWTWKHKMGEVTIKSERGNYKVNLYGANCLFAMIYEFKENGKNMYSFYGYLNDYDHLKRCLGLKPHNKYDYETKKTIKACDNMFSDWASVKLNVFYKENLKTAELLAKAGIKVSLYYKEIK